jgi:hypothetical protein
MNFGKTKAEAEKTRLSQQRKGQSRLVRGCAVVGKALRVSCRSENRRHAWAHARHEAAGLIDFLINVAHLFAPYITIRKSTRFSIISYTYTAFQ